MMKVSKRIVLLLSLAAAVCGLGNCKEYSVVYDDDGERMCAVGPPNEVRLLTNVPTLECLRLCDDNPECIVFNLYDNTTCEIFTCLSVLSRGFQIVEFCKSFRINDCLLRCSQSEYGETTYVEYSTFPVASSSDNYRLSVGEDESTTEGETTYAEYSTFPDASSSDNCKLTVSENDDITGIFPSSPPPTQPPFRDCADVRAAGHTESGVYLINVGYSDSVSNVYCDMSNSESWLVIQRRIDGSVNFERTWTEYANGFGDLTGEFWLGNEILYDLLWSGNYRLRVVIRDWNGTTAYAEYSTFFITSSFDNYRLSVGKYSGTAGDSLWDENGCQFSTRDTDNDYDSEILAQQFRGGWWHNTFSNSYARLNGLYQSGGETSYNYGIVWYTYSNTEFYSLNMTEMKIAP